MKEIFLPIKNNPLFRGLSEDEITAVLEDSGATTRAVKSGEYILRSGDTTSKTGFVLSGGVLIIQEDLWGRRNIMSRVSAGDIFAEAFAAAGDPLNVSVVADEDSVILFIDVNRLLSLQSSSKAHGDIVVRNLVRVLAKKTMAFNEKITHISKRTTREKLLSNLSAQSQRCGSLSFTIDFNRQQLADYLCVERAAMCTELSKLQKDGVLSCGKNRFTLKDRTED